MEPQRASCSFWQEPQAATGAGASPAGAGGSRSSRSRWSYLWSSRSSRIFSWIFSCSLEEQRQPLRAEQLVEHRELGQLEELAAAGNWSRSFAWWRSSWSSWRRSKWSWSFTRSWSRSSRRQEQVEELVEPQQQVELLQEPQEQQQLELHQQQPEAAGAAGAGGATSARAGAAASSAGFHLLQLEEQLQRCFERRS